MNGHRPPHQLPPDETGRWRRLTTVGPVEVSTTALPGEPTRYETVAAIHGRTSRVVTQDRYATLAQAVVGHAAVVAAMVDLYDADPGPTLEDVTP